MAGSRFRSRKIQHEAGAHTVRARAWSRAAGRRDEQHRTLDYPDFADAVGTAIRDGRADRGILICGSGVGAPVAANKIPGIRAGLCHDTYTAHQGVEHDDINVLVLGSRIIGIELAHDLVRAYLAAEFSGETRHVRRLEKVPALEMRCQSGPHRS